MKKFKSIQEELLFIYKNGKRKLDPKKVVEFAEDPKTHLHSKFEWDDEKASYQYRLCQARKIIELEFDIIKARDQEVGPLRLYVSLKDDRNHGGGYRLVTDVMKDEDLKHQLLEEALFELNRIKTKYKMLTELKNIFEAIEKAETLIFEKSEVE